MHGQFTVRIHQLAVIAGRAARWLLPWACVLVLSMTVAYIAGQALVASPSWAEAAQEAERTTGAASSSSTAVTQSAVPSARDRWYLDPPVPASAPSASTQARDRWYLDGR